MKMILDFDQEKCSACGACAIACMDQNDIEVEEHVTPLRMVCQFERTDDKTGCLGFLSIACMHCDDAPCIKACPSGCIAKDPDTNLTIYDNTNCIGCHSCSMACPFGAPSFDRNGKMIKCDGCAVRVSRGLVPACVRVCPTGALTMETGDEYMNAKKGQSLQKMIKSMEHL